AALEILKGSQDLAGERLLITVGATREEIDPVRFISNRSSGRMGFALADAALRRGGDVTLVVGNTTVNPPAGARVVRALSAEEMSRAVEQEIAKHSVFIGAAAIADYRPAQRAEQKIKKSEDQITLTLERTPDVLSQVAASRANGMLVIGFAAETENVFENAKQKLQSKNFEAIVANDVSREDSGFDTATNKIAIITSKDSVELPLMSKSE